MKCLTFTTELLSVLQTPSTSSSEAPAQTCINLELPSLSSTQGAARMFCLRDRKWAMSSYSSLWVKLATVPDILLHEWTLSWKPSCCGNMNSPRSLMLHTSRSRSRVSDTDLFQGDLKSHFSVSQLMMSPFKNLLYRGEVLGLF